MFVRVRKVVVHEVLPFLHHQAIDVHEPQVPSRVIRSEALVHKSRGHQIGNPRGGGASPQKHDRQILEGQARNPG